MRRSLEMLFLIIIAVGFLQGVCCGAESQGDDATATVKRDSLNVYSRMSESANVVKRLGKGDIVELDLEIERGGMSWCLVKEPGQVEAMGYVHCAELDRKVRATQWTHVRTTGNTSPARGNKPGSASTANAETEKSKRPYSDVKVLLYMAEW